MKKLLMLIIIVLLLGLLAGGIGFLSDGFKAWNVKDWFKKDTTSEVAIPDSIANITDWSFTFGEGDNALTLTNDTKELHLNKIDNDGKGGKLISFDRGNIVEFSSEFRAINEFAPPVNSKTFYMGVKADLFPEKIEFDIQGPNQGFFTNPYGVLTNAEKDTLKTAYEQINKPQFIGIWRFTITFMDNELYTKNINNTLSEYGQVTTVISLIPLYIEGVN